MQFPTRDFTNQYISRSYQDVLQQYLLSDTFYVLDGFGNVVFNLPSASVGQAVITSDVTSSMSVATASYTLVVGTAQTADFALLAGNAITATTSSYVSTSSYTQVYDRTPFSLIPSTTMSLSASRDFQIYRIISTGSILLNLNSGKDGSDTEIWLSASGSNINVFLSSSIIIPSSSSYTVPLFVSQSRKIKLHIQYDAVINNGQYELTSYTGTY